MQVFLFYFPKSLFKKLFFSSCISSSRSLIISRIPSTQIMINQYLYPWWLFINVEICPPKLTIQIRRRNMVTMSDRPWLRAQSANAEWFGLRYLFCSQANPVTTAMSKSVKILDSGTQAIISGAAFQNPFSSISRAVKSMTKSPSHWIDGYSSSFFAIQLDAITMSMMDITSPIMRLTIFPWLAHATASTLSRLIATSAIMIVCIAALKVVAVFPHAWSLCSLARISR